MMTKNRLRFRKSTQTNCLQAATLSASAVSGGNYTLTAVIPNQNTAAAYQFVEGSTDICNGPLSPGDVQVTLTKVLSRAAGTYVYYLNVWDNNCTSQSSNVVTVTVPAAAATTSTGTTTSTSTTTTTPATTTTTTTSYPAWAIGVSYTIGMMVSYQGANYKCINNNLSNSGWDPVDAFTLWTPI